MLNSLKSSAVSVKSLGNTEGTIFPFAVAFDKISLICFEVDASSNTLIYELLSSNSSQYTKEPPPCQLTSLEIPMLLPSIVFINLSKAIFV